MTDADVKRLRNTHPPRPPEREIAPCHPRSLQHSARSPTEHLYGDAARQSHDHSSRRVGITLSMQRASAGARHLVWLVALAACCSFPRHSVGADTVRLLPAELSSTRRTPSPDKRSPTWGDATLADAGSAPGTAPNATVLSGPVDRNVFSAMSAFSILLLIWAVVLVAIAGSLAYAALVVRRIVNRARPLDTGDWLTPLWEVSDRLSLEEPPRLLRSEDAKMPFACGLFTPTIVLPAECDGWSLDRRRAVLLHELAHVRRHDLVGHTMGRLACAVYWFHPLVWTAAKQLRSRASAPVTISRWRAERARRTTPSICWTS